MSKELNSIKSKIYYTATILFPSFYKKRFFLNLHKALASSDNYKLFSEKEFLVLFYLLKENHVAIDIGGNNGIYSYFFKEIKKAKRVLTFEPLPNLYKKLKVWFKNIELFNIALSNKKEKTKIHIPIINDKLYESRAKLDDLIEENENGFIEIEINSNTLDNILAENKLERLDIIKIDIEGHELKAIEGALNTIKKFRPYLLVEIERRHHNNSISKPVAFVCDLDYKAYFFNPVTKKLESFSEFNETEMQNNNNKTTFNYLNNFLFIPNNKLSEVDDINKNILEYFS